MPKFVVRKVQDAWVHYETIVEAETPEDARRIAKDVMLDGPWFATGDVTEFDHLEIDEETGIARSKRARRWKGSSRSASRRESATPCSPGFACSRSRSKPDISPRY